MVVETKEQADHSLPYLLAVAVLDGHVMPEQFAPVRIHREDVQRLLRKIRVQPSQVLSQRFPAEMPCRRTVRLNNGATFVAEKDDFHGFVSRPTSWQTAVEKFEQVSRLSASATLQRDIVDAVAHLDQIQTVDLTRLLATVQPHHSTVAYSRRNPVDGSVPQPRQ